MELERKWEQDFDAMKLPYDLYEPDNEVIAEKYYGVSFEVHLNKKHHKRRTRRQQHALQIMNRASGSSKKNQKHGHDRWIHETWSKRYRQAKLMEAFELDVKHLDEILCTEEPPVEAFEQDSKYWTETLCREKSPVETLLKELHEARQNLLLMEREFRERSARVAYESDYLENLGFDIALTKWNINQILSKLKS